MTRTRTALALGATCAAVVLACGGGGGSTGGSGTSTTSPGALTARYLLAFHACDTATTNCSDPRNHSTYVAQSDDGAAWTLLAGYSPHLGSVPDIVRRGSTLYVYNPGQLRRYHIDTGVWEDPIPVTVRHADGTDELFVDPSPTIDENGSIVLFYLVGQIGSDPAGCPPGVTTCTKLFRSATEVAGSDGASFTVDSGDRAQVTITTPGTASDPDIFRDAAQFVLYVSGGQSVLAYSSSTLRGSYTPITGLPSGALSTGSGGIPAGHFDSTTAQYWTYVHQPQGNVAIIRRAVHGSLSTPLADSAFSTILTGGTFAELGSTYRVESPGFAVNQP